MFEKKRIVVSKIMHHSRARELSDLSCFPLASDLSKYLGVPLLYKKYDKVTYIHLLERIQQRLSAWRVEALSFAGRDTQAPLVVVALPIYTMQIVLLLKYVCEDLERLNKDFIWG